MKKLVFASGNAGKLAEVRAVLADYNIVSPKELGIDIEVEETGASFYENALIKARALYQACGVPTLADDSGLCVNALGGAPGVYSARYSGGGDDANIQKLLDELKDEKDRSAYFVCAMVYYDGKNIISAEGKTFGSIAQEPNGDGGFGYDPIFVSDDLGKTFSAATAQEKNRVSHRARALAELCRKL